VRKFIRALKRSGLEKRETPPLLPPSSFLQSAPFALVPGDGPPHYNYHAASAGGGYRLNEPKKERRKGKCTAPMQFLHLL